MGKTAGFKERTASASPITSAAVVLDVGARPSGQASSALFYAQVNIRRTRHAAFRALVMQMSDLQPLQNRYQCRISLDSRSLTAQ